MVHGIDGGRIDNHLPSASTTVFALVAVPPPTHHLSAFHLMPLMRRAFLICGSLFLGSCLNPRVQENMAQAMTEFGNEMAAMRQDVADLQNTVDSLRQVAAKQDTIIGRLTTLAGIPR
jgi:hypothetical protein